SPGVARRRARADVAGRRRTWTARVAPWCAIGGIAAGCLSEAAAAAPESGLAADGVVCFGVAAAPGSVVGLNVTAVGGSGAGFLAARSSDQPPNMERGEQAVS